MEIHCLSCGAALRVQSPATLFIVCSYCQTTLIRDQDWAVFGKMAVLPPEITPLQIGTRGVDKGENFELIGRQRLQWRDGYWNEWCALFPKGRIGWLAEAQGFLMISFPLEPAPSLPTVTDLKVGDSIDIPGHSSFRVDDIKRATCIASEGEMPFPAPARQERLSIDASNGEGGFLSIEKIGATVHVHVGRYRDFNDFQFTHLRQLDGW
ncbi:MAG TPA: DUF4178 domain-containing protein [Oligoflexus sp.]|uniref:DUF4178 domain-containing protein n=1 Tax=Oligoflexus sp. TaxID=1971216 RepID=UPI002D57112E|nr:DUF4178 domain-containing protein [Oligoflexus sp.]HYX35148.1 DUF4178 domain-containing protein [Oligoflexus sp.]